jgi:hypothetical protein
MSAKFYRDVKYLWLEQVLEMRSNWILYLGFSLTLPLVMIFGFFAFWPEYG